jgi:hypothetical protein
MWPSFNRIETNACLPSGRYRGWLYLSIAAQVVAPHSFSLGPSIPPLFPDFYEKS